MKKLRKQRTDPFRVAMLAQHLAALAMLKDCITLCPDEHWEGTIGKYPFWHVAYHTLCFADLYTAPSNAAWEPSPRFHPKGRAELRNEYPSRRFERDELLAYLELCRKRYKQALAAETPTTLICPSGFAWVKLPRAELYPYNTRHIQHHIGQLSAFLRRSGQKPKWIFRARS